MNVGKRFETNFKKSIPDDIFYYRFRDGSSAWGGNDKVRFQAPNICDCMLYDGDYLYLLELKSCKGKSIPYHNFRENQLRELSLAQYYSNIVSGIIIEFNELNRTFFIEIDKITTFMRTSERKSIPLNYFEEFGIEIETIKKKTNSKYNIKQMIKDIVKMVI